MDGDDGPATPATPATIGPYRILDRLGRGGMGVVYRAVHVETGAPAAVKTVNVDRERVLESIRREIHALARLRHPGIVRVLDEGVDGGRPWYAMELVTGSSLRRHCGVLSSPAVDVLALTVGTTEPTLVADSLAFATAENPTAATPTTLGPALPAESLRAVLTVVRRLCRPLAFLHGEGLVHRDLKPDNVLVTEDGRPVIIDFGLATQFEGRLSLTIQQPSDQAEGTLLYMAPEQLAGTAVDARADLYALGCMLFELVAGRPPFVGSTHDIVEAHLRHPPPRLDALVPALPPGLGALVERLLAKDPRDRIGYAADVAAALARLGAAGETDEDAPPPRGHLYRPGFAGRHAALATLESALICASDGRGALALVAGESGVGKTRIVVELIRAARQRGFRVLVGESPVAVPGAAPPLELLRKPLQAIADRARTLDPVDVERLLGPRARVLALYERTLADVPGLAHHPEPPPLPPRRARERALRYVAETLAALAADAPLALVLDDLQWSDELSLALLGALCDGDPRLDGMRLLVVGAHRSEEPRDELASLGARPEVVRLQLDRLDEASIAAMVGDMLSMSPPPPVLSRYLWRHSAGNPFFVAEYLRLAVEEGLLARNPDGYWQLPETGRSDATEALYGALHLPGSVRALAARRLADLSPEAAAVVAAAAVLGRDVAPALLAAVSPADDEADFRGISELIRRQILDDAPGGHLHFQHDQLREVAYAALSDDTRRSLHAAAATAIEAAIRADPDARTVDERLAEQAGALAVHHRRSDRPREALRFARLAAQHALRRHALADAIAHYQTAIEIADALPDRDAPDLLGLRIDLRLELYAPRMQRFSAADEGMLALCREAEPLVERLGDPDRRVRLYTGLSGCWFARAAYDQLIDHARAAIAVAERTGDRGHVATIAYSLVGGYLQSGRLDEVFALTPPLCAWLEETGATTTTFGATYPPYVSLRGFLGLAHALRGDADDAAACRERTLAAAAASQHRYARALAHVLASWIDQVTGDPARAAAHADEAAAIAREAQLAGPEMLAAYAGGVARVLAGRTDEGEAALEHAVAVARELGYVAFRTEAHYGLALVHLARDQPAAAAALCREGLHAVAATGERKLEPELHRLLALAEPAAAGSHLADALRAASATGLVVFGERARAALSG